MAQTPEPLDPARLHCPHCGSAVTLGDGPAYSAPVETLTLAGKTTNGYLREVAPTLVRVRLLVTWAGCNACDWCGPVADAREAGR